MHENKPQSADNLQSMFEFLRKESAASRDALREEAEANRRLMIQTVEFASIPISILLVIAAYLGYRSISDVKQSIIAEAGRQTNAEIVRMRGVIDERLDEQFKTPNLQGTIQHAAREAT